MLWVTLQQHLPPAVLKPQFKNFNDTIFSALQQHLPPAVLKLIIFYDSIN